MNASDATGEMGKGIYKTEDEKLNLPECVYVREGYHFKGWSTKENGAVEFEDKVKGETQLYLIDDNLRKKYNIEAGDYLGAYALKSHMAVVEISTKNGEYVL